MSNKKEQWLAICDGGKRSGMAYGSYMVFTPEGDLYTHHTMVFGFGTSNVAEYLAFINVVDYCIANKLDNIKIQSDSALMLNQVSGRWRTNDTRLKKLRGVARNKLKKIKHYELEKIHNTKVKEILGH